eukprot:NP_510331.1 Insulin/EGF-Receptor L Domain protein [Caenorhabditis elegans]
MILTLCICFSTVFSYNFEDDFRILSETETCSSPCWFNKSEVTTETIELWPTNCTKVCSILTFTSTINKIPLEKLKTTFQNLTVLCGVLRIENTTLKNLSFLENLDFISNSNEFELSISHNNELEEIGILFSMDFSAIFPIQIVNNSRLDASLLCENNNYAAFDVIYVHKNLKDCGCIGTVFNENNIENYKNCTAMFGTMEFDNTSQISKFSALSNMRNITGKLIVHNTNFQNISFLENVVKFRGNSANASIDLRDNKNMTHFGLNNLTEMITPGRWFTLNFENLHPDFCLTMEEMQRFTTVNAKFVKNEAKYCNITIREDGQKTCVWDKMSTLDSQCIHVMGHVIISAGDESYVQKLQTVRNIYGSLTIQNTSLENLAFLGNLTNVANLNDILLCFNFLTNPRNFFAKIQ